MDSLNGEKAHQILTNRSTLFGSFAFLLFVCVCVCVCVCKNEQWTLFLKIKKCVILYNLI